MRITIWNFCSLVRAVYCCWSQINIAHTNRTAKRLKPPRGFDWKMSNRNFGCPRGWTWKLIEVNCRRQNVTQLLLQEGHQRGVPEGYGRPDGALRCVDGGHRPHPVAFGACQALCERKGQGCASSFSFVPWNSFKFMFICPMNSHYVVHFICSSFLYYRGVRKMGTY